MMTKNCTKDFEHTVCSIVIVNWKSYDYLAKCVGSIKESINEPYEIIVVDNASGPGEQSKLMDLDGITLILNDDNHGFAAANNIGFKRCSGNFIFMLNPDTFLYPSSLQIMIEFLKANSEVYAVGPKLFYSEKKDYHPSIKTFMTPTNQLLQLFPFYSRLKAVHQALFFKENKLARVDCLIGAAILFKKEVFETIGLLSEEFFIYAEEDDFCKRMKLIGMDIIYLPGAEIIHYGGKSQGRSNVSKNLYLWESKIRYLFKYFNPVWVKLHLVLILILLFIKKYVMSLKGNDEVIKVTKAALFWD